MATKQRLRIKQLSNHGISADYLATFKHQIEHTTFIEKASPSRILFLRPSQMPFCPLSVFITVAERGMYREQTFASAYYTSVGTVVHTIMQNFLCSSGKFLADYHCRECNKWHRLSYKHECCGFPTQYHEIEIDYKGIKGHIDSIYRDKNGKLWIIDFKTTSLAMAPKKKKDPGIVYREQIEVYAVLVELQYGIKIEGYADSFIVRDNPMKNEPPMWCTRLTDETRKRVLTRLKKYKRIHRHVLDATTKDQVLDLFEYGRCEDPWCRVCTSTKSDKNLKTRLLNAYRIGKNAGRLPIREMAEREQSKIDERRKKHG